MPQGSIGIDGISLTIARLEGDKFSVSLIPHTVKVTTLGQNGVGYEVNLEADVLGKYVEKIMHGRPARRAGGRRPDPGKAGRGRLFINR